MKQRYVEDARKHRRAAESANEELAHAKTQLLEARNECRMSQEDNKAVRQV
jgi:hypothetical protein